MMTIRQKIYINGIKRPVGFIGALLGLILLSPIFITTIILLFFVNKNGFKGIFFTQPRPGKNGKIFTALKFKTMTDARDENGDLLPDACRLTPVGKFIRSTSIDELPQLINVIKGDMALIGPRPLLVQYLPLYNEEQARRHEVRPGITGWAQVNGRNAISWKEKFDLDVWYIDNISLFIDVKIIFITIKKVLCREDINTTSGNSSTMDYFDGTN